MAKIKPIEIILTISGKLSGKSKSTICTNKVSGVMYTREEGKITKPRTEKQKASSLRFKEKQAAVCQWLKANRPSEANPEGTEAYRKAHRAYVDGHKGTFSGYVWKHLDSLI